LKLEIAQAPPAYALRLPVKITFDGGNETRWVDIAQERQTVQIDVDDAPRAVRLDPELRVYRLLEPEELPPILRQWIVAPTPTVLFAGQAEGARRLAEKVLESSFRIAEGITREPLLIVGLHEEVDAALARLGLPPRPPEVAGRGTAQVWTVRESETPVAVISAQDAASLAALERPLPHYGAQSWIVFEGPRAVARGSWTPSPPVVRVETD
jgi:hypothetical protein